ncbi:carboxy methyl transferase for protein phosphatase 2A [Scheffersomyces amazonensis]|uniref:carboxy methyl transferase for protein phosphatase 2A n=1 Tax=Scheffersomyces amazonensis TaxID=1078765 RepID=UPI00315DA73A
MNIAYKTTIALMLSPQEKKDKIIRSTDIDALSCRYSSNRLSYFFPADPYTEILVQSYQKNLQYCQGYTGLSSGRLLRSSFGEKKFPLINRGTYFRTKAIDLIVDQFLKEFPSGQIVSLGGGSDTRAFRILHKYKHVSYFEIDFPESVKIKHLAILQSEELKNIIEYEGDDKVEINNKQEFENFQPCLHTPRYHLVSYDLRNLAHGSKDFVEQLQTFNPGLPTLLLSECVLCYMNPEENIGCLKYFKDICIDYLSVVIYEPISLGDTFGATMARNLSERGINLLTFNEFPDLKSKLKFLHDICGFQTVRLTDLSSIAGYGRRSEPHKESWVDVQEIYRINHIELIDEVEEIRLLLQHYCFCFAEWSPAQNQKHLVGIDRWNWLESLN